MRKSFRKALVYLLAIGLLMPTWLVTGMMNATRAKAAEPIIVDYTFNGSDEDLHLNNSSFPVIINITADQPVRFSRVNIINDEDETVKYFSQSSLLTSIERPWNGNPSGEDSAFVPDGEYRVEVNTENEAGEKGTEILESSIFIDNEAPTATISYSVTEKTNQDVVATLNADDGLTILNNYGSRAYTFKENGSFTFEFADEAGNLGTALAVVTNIDKISPEISLIGDEEISIPLNSEYLESGFIAKDNVDGAIEASDVAISGTVNEALIGDYKITYTVKDQAGNETSVERIVHVVENASTIKIDLDGNEKSIKSPDGNLTLSGLKTKDGLAGNVMVEKLTGAPENGALAIAVDGFFYEIKISDNVAFPVQLEIAYSDDTTAANYLNEQKFVSLYYFDAATSVWKDYRLDNPNPSTVVIDKENNKITASIQHLTPIVPVVDTVAPLAPANVKTSVAGKIINVSWDAIVGANYYYVYSIPKANGAISSTNSGVKSDKITDTKYSVTVGNYGDYYIVVTSVDEYGNESTLPLEKDQTVVNVAAPVVTQAVVATTQAPVVTAAPAKAKAVPAPAEQKIETPADDSNGKIKGDDTETNEEEEKVNWTPWIVLFVLILLAGAATGGYFYWFNGEEEVEAVVKEPKKLEKKVAKPKASVKKSSSHKKQKRW